jgi:RimJ/RimL family protein N-acetyltransferase
LFERQPHLTEELVELRPVSEADFFALFAAASDPRIWEQHPEPRHREGVFRTFFADQLASRGGLLVLERRTGAVIGTTRFDGYDAMSSEIEIGWTFLVRRCWGGAHNGEMKALMLKHAFHFVQNVTLVVHSQNVRSQRAIEKIGGRRTGKRVDDYGRDMLVYRVRSSAWTGSPQTAPPR